MSETVAILRVGRHVTGRRQLNSSVVVRLDGAQPGKVRGVIGGEIRFQTWRGGFRGSRGSLGATVNPEGRAADTDQTGEHDHRQDQKHIEQRA